ncbi:Cytochrome c oxidase assembly factor 4 -like protein, mitochondrial, partial [Trichinella sp. T8]
LKMSGHRVVISRDDVDQFDKLLEKSGCAKEHYVLQDCYAEHKDWRKCKKEIDALRKCMKVEDRTESADNAT